MHWYQSWTHFPAVSSCLHNFPRTLPNLLPWLAYQPNLGSHFLWRVCPHTDCNTGRLLAVSLGLIYRQVVTLWRVRVTLVLCWLVYITRGITNHSILSIYLIISNGCNFIDDNFYVLLHSILHKTPPSTSSTPGPKTNLNNLTKVEVNWT